MFSLTVLIYVNVGIFELQIQNMNIGVCGYYEKEKVLEILCIQLRQSRYDILHCSFLSTSNKNEPLETEFQKVLRIIRFVSLSYIFKDAQFWTTCSDNENVQWVSYFRFYCCKEDAIFIILAAPCPISCHRWPAFCFQSVPGTVD